MARRSDGARQWAAVLSDLAQVPVTVEWEAPAWRVRWQDGPVRTALTTRVHDLSRHRVGMPLTPADMRFTRIDSATAVALGWLRLGSPRQADGSERAAEVESLCETTAYPLQRSSASMLTTGQTLAAVAQQDRAQIGALLTAAVPAVLPWPWPADEGPDLPGRVTAYSWPDKGPPAELLGPTPTTTPGPGQTTVPAAIDNDTTVPGCERCGRPLPPAGRVGRRSVYCSGACRTAAYRHRNQIVTPAVITSQET